MRIGVSSCLFGNKVRYDGQHKLNRFIVDNLAGVVDLVSICPEVEFGLETLREPINLTAANEGIRLLGTRSRRDITEPMRKFVRGRVTALASENLSRFVLKKDSPRCGMECVKVFWYGGMS